MGSVADARLEDSEVTVVGAGRSGSFLAVVLAMLGVPLRIYDPDILGPENQGRQLYRRADIAARRPKVRALGRFVRAIVPGARLRAHAELFAAHSRQVVSPLVVVAVDTMAERRRVWEWLRPAPPALLVDVRLGPGQVRLHTVEAGRPGDAEDYEASLHADPPAGGTGCAAVATAHAAAAAAALVAGCLRAHVDGQRRPRWLAVDLDRGQWVGGPVPADDRLAAIPDTAGILS